MDMYGPMAGYNEVDMMSEKDLRGQRAVPESEPDWELLEMFCQMTAEQRKRFISGVEALPNLAQTE